MKNIGLTGMLTMSIIAGVMISGGCKKEVAGPQGAQGPAGPYLTGTLQGHVFLFDQYGNTVLTNLAASRDSIDGTATVATTDSTGLYTFAGLNTGTYSFTVSQAGYGMNHLQDLQFVGGGTVEHDVRISQVPSFNVTTLTAGFSAVYDTLKGTIPADTHARSVIVFTGASSSVSSDPSTYLDFVTKTIPPNATNFMILLPADNLYELGLNTGSTAYFAAYGIASNFNNSSSYEDLATGRTVFTAVSSTPASANGVVQ